MDEFFNSFGVIGLIVWNVIKILSLVIPLLLAVAYYTYFERKVIGFMHCRVGPNRVGPRGLLQPIADGLKLIFKEILLPEKSNRYLYLLAPVLSFAPALAAWAVVPFDDGLVIADINVGLLYLFAMTSIGVYGVVIAGWASNSKYAFLGALRSAAQIVSYEIAMGFTIIGVVIASQTLNISEIVNAQSGSIANWYMWPLFPLFIVYVISAFAETNRAPFDVAEGESEIVAGFHVEYAGMSFALFFIAEYTNMILVCILCSLLFVGGWHSPFESITLLNPINNIVPSIVWLLLKTGFFMFSFLWVRATLPRYRYDQIMRLGWKIFIPITFFWIVVVAFAVKLNVSPWFN